MTNQNNDLRASVAASLSAAEMDIYEYLPYILQDLWEMGISPQVVVELIERHRLLDSCSKAADLGCGKGAAAIGIARQLGCKVIGIDGMPEFIQTAKAKSLEYGVSELCSFSCGDVRERIGGLKDFDLAVWGSVGSIFGSAEKTLNALAGCLKPQGFLIYDDGYIPEDRNIISPLYLKRSELVQTMASAGFKILEEHNFSAEHLKNAENGMQSLIIRRCQELIEQYPDKADLFRQYISAQAEEWREMQDEIVCVTFLLQRVQ